LKNQKADKKTNYYKGNCNLDIPPPRPCPHSDKSCQCEKREAGRVHRRLRYSYIVYYVETLDQKGK
jgi:hypothetical protein